MQSDRNHQELRLVLPGYRRPYAGDDFTDMQVRLADREIADHLLAEAGWAIGRRPQQICIEMHGVQRSPAGERSTEAAYRALLRRCASYRWRAFLGVVPQSLVLVVLGVGLLYLANLLKGASPKDVEHSTWAEIVRLGGWIALWTSTGLLFSEGLPALFHRHVYRRLARLPFEFRYRSKDVVESEEAASQPPAAHPERAAPDVAPSRLTPDATARTGAPPANQVAGVHAWYASCTTPPPSHSTTY